MNILLFLIPKEKVAYVYDDSTIRQTVEKMNIYGFTSIPILNKEGEYVSSIAEGDILRYIRHAHKFDYQKSESDIVKGVTIQRAIAPIKIDAQPEDLLNTVINQNYVPVIDDLNHFIGIITRRDLITYFIKNGIKS